MSSYGHLYHTEEYMGLVIGMLGIRHAKLNNVVLNIREPFLHRRETVVDQAESSRSELSGSAMTLLKRPQNKGLLFHGQPLLRNRLDDLSATESSVTLAVAGRRDLLAGRGASGAGLGTNKPPGRGEARAGRVEP